WIPEFIAGLPRTQFQRVDRTSMFHTIETRLPFFDTGFADYAIGIPAGLKLKQDDGRKTHKWILRRAMEDRLPDYIIGREKLALSQGAGYHGKKQASGFLSDFIKDISKEEFDGLKKRYPALGIDDLETAYYFKLFAENLYTKDTSSMARPFRFIYRSSIRGRIAAFMSMFGRES
ncbi:MAG: asparagine synthase-related protein, partial [Candidatus Micrarchaeia archaeon]